MLTSTMAQIRCTSGIRSCSRASPLSTRPVRQPRELVVLAGVKKELPIFPLGLVAFPVASVPLRIFEARYRVLFHTLLDGSSGIDEGLVVKDSPFCGTKRFGMCFIDQSGRLATTGTTLEIQEHISDDEGRMFITNKGVERFRILEVVKERPVLTCQVEILDEDENMTEEAVTLANEVAELFRNTIRLHIKMNGIKAPDDVLEPAELKDATPRELSYWIASVFSDVRPLQQRLLEEDNTLSRLKKEKDILNETVRYYSAASALKFAFNAGTGSEGTDATVGASVSGVEGGSSDSSPIKEADKQNIEGLDKKTEPGAE